MVSTGCCGTRGHRAEPLSHAAAGSVLCSARPEGTGWHCANWCLQQPELCCVHKPRPQAQGCGGHGEERRQPGLWEFTGMGQIEGRCWEGAGRGTAMGCMGWLEGSQHASESGGSVLARGAPSLLLCLKQPREHSSSTLPRGEGFLQHKVPGAASKLSEEPKQHLYPSRHRPGKPWCRAQQG